MCMPCAYAQTPIKACILCSTNFGPFVAKSETRINHALLFILLALFFFESHP